MRNVSQEVRFAKINSGERQKGASHMHDAHYSKLGRELGLRRVDEGSLKLGT